MSNCDQFTAVILSHGRAENVKTWHSLRRCGYTGKIFILCDDEDKSLPVYRKKYGDSVWVFSKKEYGKTFDRMDNFGKMGAVVYARNAVCEIARQHGFKYIVVLDDDYFNFEYRVTKTYEYGEKRIKNLDAVFACCLDFLKTSHIQSFCFMQSGDFIGGALNHSFSINKTPTRKGMNLFFLDTEKPIAFLVTLNEDATAAVSEAIQGRVMLSTPLLTLQQEMTQQNKGGLTELYLDCGTYVKSFYTVMYCPSAVSIGILGNFSPRFHHHVRWKYCTPKIIREDYKKDGKNRQKKDND